MKRDLKTFIINTSKEYSIVSQFTSFVAIEKREKVCINICTPLNVSVNLCDPTCNKSNTY